MAIIKRAMAVAGSFYPSGRNELQLLLNKFFGNAKKFGIIPKCLIAPHAGYIYSGEVAGVAYEQLADLQDTYRKIILLGPSHYELFIGAAFASYHVWTTPLGEVPVFRIPPSDILIEYTQAHALEHCLEVQLPFLQYILKNFSIIPIVTGEIRPESLGKELLPYIDKHTLLCVSSDLSHYLPYEKAKKIDSRSNEIISKTDYTASKNIDACGKTAIRTALYIAKVMGWKGYFLDYKNSGDTAGSKESVVGYGAYAFI